MTPLEFFVYGLIGIFFAALIAYPFSMNYARRASAWVLKRVSQEAIISMFTGLIVVLSYSEGGLVAWASPLPWPCSAASSTATSAFIPGSSS